MNHYQGDQRYGAYSGDAMPEYYAHSRRDFEAGYYDGAEEFPFGSLAKLGEALREIMHESYSRASPEEMQTAVLNLFDSMSAAEGFNFGQVLQQIGQAGQSFLRDPTVSQIARTALPIVGGAVGTFAGGPIGTALGSQLGNVAAQAFTGGQGQAPARAPAVPPTAARPAGVQFPSTPAPTTQAAPVSPATAASPQGGSAAAAQLLQLTQNPDVLRALASLAMGAHGRSSVPVGQSGTAEPVAAIVNLLGSLAGRAAEDADELLRGGREPSHYLRDVEGNYVADPATTEGRAEALYQQLWTADNQRMQAEASEYFVPHR